MEIVIIGSGNIAHSFGHLLELQGHRIHQVLSRDSGHARELAERLNAQYSSDLDEIWLSADVYLLAVSDHAIAELNGYLRLGRRIVVHTAGAVALSAIQNISKCTGVLYPLQSIRKDIKQARDIPVLVEASDKITLTRLKTLAESISSKVREVDSEQRLKIHLAAVFCNNFTNYLFTIAKDYCQKESLDFDLLKPLLHETFSRLERYDPRDVQTGPAMRNDTRTLEQHRGLLSGYPEIWEVYRLLSRHIYDYYSTGSGQTGQDIYPHS